MSHDQTEANKSNAAIQYHDMMLRSIETNVKDLTRFSMDYQKQLVTLAAKFDEHVKTCDVTNEQARKAMQVATDAIAQLTRHARTALTPVRGAPVQDGASTQSVFDSKTALIQKMPWWAKRLFDKAFDYAIFAIIFLCVFAWKHGAQLPIPGQ